MPSRRCPHCRVVTSYSSSPASGLLFDKEKRTYLRLDTCLDNECGGVSAVVFNNPQFGEQVDIFPAVEEGPDELLPDGVKTAFRQALKSLDEGIWDACVLMARRALEEAMADLGAEGRDLYKKIEYLADNQKITPDLKEWAHEGRLGGKLGAHGKAKDEAKEWNEEVDAEEIVEFAKWFFRYVYILPKQLEERRARLPAEQSHKGDPETPES